jgi:hypothetical protein
VRPPALQQELQLQQQPQQQRQQACAVDLSALPDGQLEGRAQRLAEAVRGGDEAVRGQPAAAATAKAVATPVAQQLLQEAGLNTPVIARVPRHELELAVQASQSGAVGVEGAARRSVQLHYVLSFGAHGAHSF